MPIPRLGQNAHDLGMQQVPVSEIIVKPVALMDVVEGAVLDLPVRCYVRIILPGEGKVIVVPFDARGLRQLGQSMQKTAEKLLSPSGEVENGK